MGGDCPAGHCRHWDRRGIFMLRLPVVQHHLFSFIGTGAIAIHLLWFASVPIIGDQISEYSGVPPINLLLTFLISGLLFRQAIWIGAAAALGYTAVFLLTMQASIAPVIYLLISGGYAGFATFIAERARRDAWSERQALDMERERSEMLLRNTLPHSIAKRMKAGESLIADQFDDAAVLFADIVGFTEMSAKRTAREVVEILDEIFKRFDQISTDLDLEKIKTIGDCYMVVGGLPSERPREPSRIAEAALRMQEALGEIASRLEIGLLIRIGLHRGPVVAGVIGTSKFSYTGSRMEPEFPVLTQWVGTIQVHP
jgi:class 3 adenylate cyclase